MIVKNESRIIERLLTSVLPLIDTYCICDTGSTDNTVELIEAFFDSKSILGKIIREPFQDFAHNRTYALKQCYGMPDADFILLVDADMIMEIGPDCSIQEFKNSLSADLYFIFQGTEQFFYKNARLVKNMPSISYWGVTHEYLKMPENTVNQMVDRTTLFINDVGDGGAKSDKFERDIRLLTKGLEDEPNNVRYLFYLANSYRDGGQLTNAIDTYKLRISLGGWIEEVWFSYYSIGKCYQMLGDMANAIYYWLEGYQAYPKRIENLYHVIHHYRATEKYELAYIYYDVANYQRSVNTIEDCLFLEKDVYDFRLDYEFTILSYYCNHRNFDVPKICMKVLQDSKTEETLVKNVLTNYKFYAPKLIDLRDTNPSVVSNLALLSTIGENLKSDLVSSTPSVCMLPNNQLAVNVRYISYFIDENGGYQNRDKIITKNVMAIVDTCFSAWKVTSEFELGYNKMYDDYYIGIEDVRLYERKGWLMFNGNRGFTNGCKVEHGMINLKTKQTTSSLVVTENQTALEKNWVMFTQSSDPDKVMMVYHWFPLKIGECRNHRAHQLDDFKQPLSELVITQEEKTPNFFRYLRGSTNGLTFPELGEIWFLCHLVSYEDRRYYYHVFVVLDEKTLKVKKYSRIFTFEKEKVEYSLGFVYMKETKQFLIGYSVMDKETKFIMVDKDKVDALF